MRSHAAVSVRSMTMAALGHSVSAEKIRQSIADMRHWRIGSEEDPELLRNCYWNCLELARANDIHSIAFPAISTGVYGYPVKEAAEVSYKAVTDWLTENADYGMDVLLACFNDKTVEAYRSISE